MKSYVQYTELYSNQNKRFLDSWLIHGKASYSFDDYLKGYVLSLNSASIQGPRSSKDSFRLIRPYLLLQVFFYQGKQFTLELGTTDSEGIKRRIIITQTKSIIRNLMHARLPSAPVEKHTWLHLYIHIPSLFALSFPLRSFRSLDTICFSGTCKLRRMYSISDMDIDYALPSGFELPRHVPYKTQCIALDSYKMYTSTNNYSNSEKIISKQGASNSISMPELKHRKPGNIFSDANHRVAVKLLRNSMSEMEKEYISGLSIGAKKYFRKGVDREEVERKAVDLRSKLKKITHNHIDEGGREGGDAIEEDIRVEKSNVEVSIIEALQSRGDEEKGVFESPNYFDASIKAALAMRHVTPPFVNTDKRLKYNPVNKFYELESATPRDEKVCT